MRSLLGCLFLMVSLFFACNKEGTGPENPPTSGTVTVTSKLLGNQAAGFSFELGKVVTVSNPENVTPDFFVSVLLGDRGEILGVFFTSWDLNPMFSLIDEASTPDSARMQFDELTEIPDSTIFYPHATPVRENQIWALKTLKDTYAKILILETRTVIDSSNAGGPTPIGEATFEWVHQPDGSRKF